MKLRTIAALAAPLAFASGCEADDWGPERLGRGHIVESAEQLRRGAKVYAAYCVGCHGEEGDGNGPAAVFLNPKPRDFRVGRLKFAAVEAGQAPRDEDYLRVIDNGLQGTAMPGFRLLSSDEKAALIEYIKAFYPEWSDDPPGAPVGPGQDPWTDDLAGGIEAGKVAYYAVAKCWSCHPAYETRAEIIRLHEEADMPEPELRPNLYETETKESNWGADIRAPDFFADRIKTGFEADRIARVIASGVGGTAMPTWAGSIESEQIWGIAHYVSSLALKRDTPAAAALKVQLLAQPAE